MKRIHLNGLFLFLLAVFLTSGAPRINTSITKEYPPLDYKEDVKVFYLNDSISSKAEELGFIDLGDTGFTTKCNLEQMLEYAKIEARKIGGNAIKIIKHKSPDLSSTCHRIVLLVFKISDSDIPKAQDSIVDSVKKDYALLHVYRVGNYGYLVEYDLYLGDSVICRVESDWRKTIRIKKDGFNSLWARTETKQEVPINIKLGQEYYIRCDVGMGAFVGRPVIEVVSNDIGRYEFKSVKFYGIELPDLLVLKDGRQIDCKVHNQDSSNVYFSIVKNEKEIKTQISKTEVEEIIFGQ